MSSNPFNKSTKPQSNPNQSNPTPKEDTMRESTKKQFLKEINITTDSIDNVKFSNEDLIKQIEEEIFLQSGKNSKDKVYRDLAKKVQNRIKGSSKASVRVFLRSGLVNIIDLVKLSDKDFDEIIKSLSGPSNENKKINKPPKLQLNINQSSIEMTMEEMNQYKNEVNENLPDFNENNQLEDRKNPEVEQQENVAEQDNKVISNSLIDKIENVQSENIISCEENSEVKDNEKTEILNEINVNTIEKVNSPIKPVSVPIVEKKTNQIKPPIINKVNLNINKINKEVTKSTLTQGTPKQVDKEEKQISPKKQEEVNKNNSQSETKPTQDPNQNYQSQQNNQQEEEKEKINLNNQAENDSNSMLNESFSSSVYNKDKKIETLQKLRQKIEEKNRQKLNSINYNSIKNEEKSEKNENKENLSKRQLNYNTNQSIDFNNTNNNMNNINLFQSAYSQVQEEANIKLNTERDRTNEKESEKENEKNQEDRQEYKIQEIINREIQSELEEMREVKTKVELELEVEKNKNSLLNREIINLRDELQKERLKGIDNNTEIFLIEKNDLKNKIRLLEDEKKSLLNTIEDMSSTLQSFKVKIDELNNEVRSISTYQYIPISDINEKNFDDIYEISNRIAEKCRVFEDNFHPQSIKNACDEYKLAENNHEKIKNNDFDDVFNIQVNKNNIILNNHSSPTKEVKEYHTHNNDYSLEKKQISPSKQVISINNSNHLSNFHDEHENEVLHKDDSLNKVKPMIRLPPVKKNKLKEEAKSNANNIVKSKTSSNPFGNVSGERIENNNANVGNDINNGNPLDERNDNVNMNGNIYEEVYDTQVNNENYNYNENVDVDLIPDEVHQNNIENRYNISNSKDKVNELITKQQANDEYENNSNQVKDNQNQVDIDQVIDPDSGATHIQTNSKIINDKKSQNQVENDLFISKDENAFDDFLNNSTLSKKEVKKININVKAQVQNQQKPNFQIINKNLNTNQNMNVNANSIFGDDKEENFNKNLSIPSKSKEKDKQIIPIKPVTDKINEKKNEIEKNNVNSQIMHKNEQVTKQSKVQAVNASNLFDYEDEEDFGNIFDKLNTSHISNTSKTFVNDIKTPIKTPNPIKVPNPVSKPIMRQVIPKQQPKSQNIQAEDFF